MITKGFDNTTGRYKKIKEIYSKNIKVEIESSFDFITISEKGLKSEIIKTFMLYFDISQENTADFLNVSLPTIYRWIKNNKVLGRNNSVKLFEISDLFLYGIDVFESRENFMKWLKLPNTALGGMMPFDLLEIPNGTSKVRDLLGRIEHGIYS